MDSTIAEKLQQAEAKIAQSELQYQRISANIAAAYDEAEAKGATMPVTENSDNLADTVASIPEAVQPTLITKQITENDTYTAADDNADGYSEVEVDVSDPIVNQLLDGTCTELINHSVTSLKQYCFYQNDALQKIYCKEVTTLGYACFQGAHYLMVAFFPKITMINYNIFYGSGLSRPEGMQALILKKQVTLRDRGSFTQNTTNFYVPSALLSWYSSATNWSAYYGNGRILAIEDNLEFLESFGFTEEELLSAEE